MSREDLSWVDTNRNELTIETGNETLGRRSAVWTGRALSDRDSHGWRAWGYGVLPSQSTISRGGDVSSRSARSDILGRKRVEPGMPSSRSFITCSEEKGPIGIRTPGRPGTRHDLHGCRIRESDGGEKDSGADGQAARCTGFRQYAGATKTSWRDKNEARRPRRSILNNFPAQRRKGAPAGADRSTARGVRRLTTGF